MKRDDIPNIITILRIGLVPPVVVALLNEQFSIALLLFAIAGASDGLDGYIAKRYGYESRLGSVLDPLADKLLLVCTFLTLGWIGLLPLWLIFAIVVRDILIVAGGLAYHYLIEHYEMVPTLISKTNTFTQIVLAFVVVLSQGLMHVPDVYIGWLVVATLVTTVLSGLDYVWTWGLRAFRAKSKQVNV